MKLKSEQLSRQFQKQFFPVFLVSGDEPLLVQEACDQIRDRAKEMGFIERELFHGEKGDLDTFSSASETMSLFAEQKVYEFRFNKAPAQEFCKAFLKWCENPPEDQLLLISCSRLDKKVTSKPWYKSLEKLGAHVEIWPVDAKNLTGWLVARARTKGLTFVPKALNVLAERVEGNLLAAEQELQRLSLLYGDGKSITDSMMRDYVGDNARFDSFELLEASFLGDAKRMTRILTGLRLEGEAAAKINGLLTYELRNVTKMAWDVHQGEAEGMVMKKYYVWGNKKLGYSKSLKRFPVSVWQRLLSRCLDLDKMIKGQQSGDSWVALESILLQISGHSLWKAK